MVKTYRVVLERDPSGAWLAEVPEVPGAHTYGRTLEQTRRRIREALSLWVDDADRAELDLQIRLPAGVARRAEHARAARQAAEEAEREASDLTVAFVRWALDSELSLRDVGELLGVSRQRVQQIAQTASAHQGRPSPHRATHSEARESGRQVGGRRRS